MALLHKNGKTVEVIDPVALRLLDEGWETADAEQSKQYYAGLSADESSYAGKVKKAIDAGLDPYQAQPAQPHHITPQVTPARQAELDAADLRETAKRTKKNAASRDFSLDDVDVAEADNPENRKVGGKNKAQGDSLDVPTPKVEKNPTPTPVNDFKGSEFTQGPKGDKPVEDTSKA
jgi:hypothetical protein